MSNGRRRTIIASLFIGLLGNIVTYYLNFYVIMIGRFMFGISNGIFSSTILRFINETLPFHIADSFSVGYVFISTVGCIIAFYIGSLLPADDQYDQLMETQNWRIIYVYFPASLYIFTIFGFIFIIKEDSIKYLIMNDINN